jgi:hypothetical protein
MSEESQNPIEKLLRAGGRRRVASTGQVTGPSAVTRELLQREVDRLRPVAAPASPAGWAWKLLLPRLAWAAGFCLVILVVGVLFYRPRQEQERMLLVRNESASEAPAISPAPSVDIAKSASAPAQVISSELAAREKDVPRLPTASSAQRTARLSSASAPAAAVSTKEVMKAKEAPPPAVQSLASVSKLSQEQANRINEQMVQRFRQISSPVRYRRNLNSPPVPRVLQDFRVEQEADRIRIIDQDGSIYVGRIDRKPARFSVVDAASSTRGQSDWVMNVAPQPAASAVPPEGWVPAYEIEAEGVNRTLNQSVKVQANVLDQARPTERAPTKTTAVAESAASYNKPENLEINLPMQRMVGTVTVASTNRLRLEAETERTAPK